MQRRDFLRLIGKSMLAGAGSLGSLMCACSNIPKNKRNLEDKLEYNVENGILNQRQKYRVVFPDNYEDGLTKENPDYSQLEWRGIKVTGNPVYIYRQTNAIDFLYVNEPHYWELVKKNIKRITLNGKPGIDVISGRMTTGDAKKETEINASLFVHEAMHRELFRKRQSYEGKEAEIKCLEVQNAFLKKRGIQPINVEKVIEMEYWKVPYLQRDW